MLKGIGCLCICIGSSGFAFCLCRERREQLELLKELRESFLRLQNEILYLALPLPELFAKIGADRREPVKGLFESCGGRLQAGREETFSEIWEMQISEMCRTIRLSHSRRKLLLSFPGVLTMGDSKGQADALELYIRELEKEIEGAEKEAKEKDRIIMSLGVAAGLLLTVLLI